MTPASAFGDEEAQMAGVVDTRVEREEFDTEYWGKEIVVDMDPAAKPLNLTASPETRRHPASPQ